MAKPEIEEEFMYNFIRGICERIGPRLTFTKKEEEGAKFVEYEFKKYCEDTNIEKFSARSGLFLIEFRFATIFYIVSAISYIFIPWISLILMIFNIATLLLVNIWNIR